MCCKSFFSVSFSLHLKQMPVIKMITYFIQTFVSHVHISHMTTTLAGPLGSDQYNNPTTKTFKRVSKVVIFQSKIKYCMLLVSKSKFSYLQSTNTSHFVQLEKRLRFPVNPNECHWTSLLNVICVQNVLHRATWGAVWGRKCGFRLTANGPGSQSVELWLHHLVGPDERGLMMAVTRGKVGIFLCQLLGLQPDTGQRGCDYDLIPRRSFSPESQRNSAEKRVSGDAHNNKIKR